MKRRQSAPVVHHLSAIKSTLASRPCRTQFSFKVLFSACSSGLSNSFSFFQFVATAGRSRKRPALIVASQLSADQLFLIIFIWKLVAPWALIILRPNGPTENFFVTCLPLCVAQTHFPHPIWAPAAGNADQMCQPHTDTDNFLLVTRRMM